MAAYYNEIDPYAAQWLRNLIAAGHIAPGDVDERDIRDVLPADLMGYTQCHFFAGIGAWSYALRRAGWPDDRSAWTGSCPCQPFSAAGKGAGFADERHLWPDWLHLISQRRPAVVFGEQVASKDSDPWIDLVQADMEALGHAFGAIPFPSAGVGAPHIRDRIYWVADANGLRFEGFGGSGKSGTSEYSEVGGVGNATGERRGEKGIAGPGSSQWIADAGSVISRMADHELQQRSDAMREACATADAGGRDEAPDQTSGLGSLGDAGPTNGIWRNSDWLHCRDGKWRPVEPGTFPLAHGAASRVGRLRAYGNAINAEAARIFIEAVMA